MIFCLMRYDLSDFFRHNKPLMTSSEGFETVFTRLSSKSTSLGEKDKAIEDLRSRFEQKYLRYCDPLNKLHYMVSVVARSVTCMLTIVVHHPRHYPDRGASLPQSEHDLLYDNALKIIEYGNLLQSSPMTRGFLWHVNVFFTWQAFIFLLDYVATTPPGPRTGTAWAQVEQVYRHHPALITERSNKLHLAIRRLTLKAWAAREAQSEAAGRPLITPNFIKMLQAEGGAVSKKTSRAPEPLESDKKRWKPNGNPAAGMLPFQAAPGTMQHTTPTMPTPEGSSGMREPSFSDYETPTDWAQWDDLIGGFEWQNFDSTGFGFDFAAWNANNTDTGTNVGQQ